MSTRSGARATCSKKVPTKVTLQSSAERSIHSRRAEAREMSHPRSLPVPEVSLPKPDSLGGLIRSGRRVVPFAVGILVLALSLTRESATPSGFATHVLAAHSLLFLLLGTFGYLVARRTLGVRAASIWVEVLILALVGGVLFRSNVPQLVEAWPIAGAGMVSIVEAGDYIEQRVEPPPGIDRVRPLTLRILLGQRYVGSSGFDVEIEGRRVGRIDRASQRPGQTDNDFRWSLPIPADLVRGEGMIVVRLYASPVDPNLTLATLPLGSEESGTYGTSFSHPRSLAARAGIWIVQRS